MTECQQCSLILCLHFICHKTNFCVITSSCLSFHKGNRFRMWLEQAKRIHQHFDIFIYSLDKIRLRVKYWSSRRWLQNVFVQYAIFVTVNKNAYAFFRYFVSFLLLDINDTTWVFVNREQRKFYQIFNSMVPGQRSLC